MGSDSSTTISTRGLVVVVAVASLTAAAVGGAGVALAVHQFDDVGDANFFHDSIGQIVEAGCATGFPDDTFRSGQGATRGQFSFWTSNCGARVANLTGSVTLSPDNAVEVTTPIIPASANDSGFIVMMVDWTAKPAAPELAGLDLRDDNDIRPLGGNPPCPCGVTGHHQIGNFGEGSVGQTVDVWPSDDGTSVEPAMRLSGSATFVIPAGPLASVDLESVFLYEASDAVFAGLVRVTYHMTGFFMPFGWDGSQELRPPD
jgi:hypothetical protein